MIKKLLLGLTLFVFTVSCFAGYSSGGGRSGFSGSKSYSSGRSGYARSTNAVRRAYVAPSPSHYGSFRPNSTTSRSYSGGSTVIHNNHYSNNRSWGFGGSSFFSGLLGGYLGGSLAHHGTTVVAGGAPVVAQGQGMLMEGAAPIVTRDPMNTFLAGIFGVSLILGLVVGVAMIFRAIFYNPWRHRNRW